MAQGLPETMGLQNLTVHLLNLGNSVCVSSQPFPLLSSQKSRAGGASGSYQGLSYIGNRSGYRDNRPYRRDSIGVTDRFFDKTKPTKPAYSVNRLKISVNRSGFVGFENDYCSGFLNPGSYSLDHSLVPSIPLQFPRS
jgi:hypothetical protein